MKRIVAAVALAAVTSAPYASASLVVSLPPAPGVAPVIPALSRESALVIWDAASKREHLVLDLDVIHCEARLGLLVPVPAVPELAALDKSPFAALANELPFERARTSLVFTGQGWKNAQKPPAGIDLYAEQRIGVFTATVLAARDEASLSRWLSEGGFDAPEGLASFRARYAALGFQLVALRYEPASPPEPAMTSQTLRLSFATPAPYFPYFERTTARPSSRSASVWLVTRNESLVPVAARAAGFARPFAEGGRYRVGRFVVERAIGELAALLPSGAELGVQVFEDRKTARDGFSDVVWVPEVELAADTDRRELATFLDPRLGDTPPPVTLASPIASVPTTPVTVTTTRCSLALPGQRGAGSAWLALAIALGLRRRWLASLIALGCRRESAPPPPPAPPPAMASAPSFASAERMREVDAIVRGSIPPGGIPVVAEDPGAPSEPPRRPSIKLDAVAEGSVTREVVLRTVRANASRFRACYDLGLRTLPSLGGKVTAFVTVSTTGHTEKARVKDDLPHAATVACLTSVFQSLSYPPSVPAGPSSATIELELSR